MLPETEHAHNKLIFNKNYDIIYIENKERRFSKERVDSGESGTNRARAITHPTKKYLALFASNYCLAKRHSRD